MDLNRWIKKVEEEINEISKLKPKDRLELVSSIIKCNVGIKASSDGWNTWLANAMLLNNFNEEDLRKIFKEFKQMSLTFLENDIKWTQNLSKKFKNKVDNIPKDKYIS